MNRQQVHKAVVDTADRFGERNPQQIRELKRCIACSELAEAVQGLLDVFVERCDAKRVSARQELAGQLLDSLSALPRAELDLGRMLRSVLPNYERSVEQLPRYLAKVHGREAVIDALTEILRQPLPPAEEQAAKTMAWWLGGGGTPTTSPVTVGAATVDMPRPEKLFRARQLWLALLDSGAGCDSTRWQGWADARIRDQGEELPPWLLALSMATARDQAIEALRANIGLDYTAYPRDAIDREALTIGFIYGRHQAGELSLEQAWSQMRNVTDIAEFLDSGKWKACAGEDAKANTEPVTPSAKWFNPLNLFSRSLEAHLIDDFEKNVVDVIDLHYRRDDWRPAAAALRERIDAGQSLGEALRGARLDADAPLPLLRIAIRDVLGVDSREAARLIARESTLYDDGKS